MDFSDRLRELLTAAGITRSEFASDLCISSSTVGNYINGKREPDLETLKKIAGHFHVTTDYLLGMDSGDCADPGENKLSLIYRSLNNGHRESLLDFGEFLMSKELQALS